MATSSTDATGGVLTYYQLYAVTGPAFSGNTAVDTVHNLVHLLLAEALPTVSANKAPAAATTSNRRATRSQRDLARKPRRRFGGR